MSALSLTERRSSCRYKEINFYRSWNRLLVKVNWIKYFDPDSYKISDFPISNYFTRRHRMKSNRRGGTITNHKAKTILEPIVQQEGSHFTPFLLPPEDIPGFLPPGLSIRHLDERLSSLLRSLLRNDARRNEVNRSLPRVVRRKKRKPNFSL